MLYLIKQQQLGGEKSNLERMWHKKNKKINSVSVGLLVEYTQLWYEVEYFYFTY